MNIRNSLEAIICGVLIGTGIYLMTHNHYDQGSVITGTTLMVYLFFLRE